MAVSSVLPLLCREQRLQRDVHIEATAELQHLLPTLHERRCHRPCKARFRLAGWPLPGGSRTLWIAMKGFRSHVVPLSWIFPVATAVVPPRQRHRQLSRLNLSHVGLAGASKFGPSRYQGAVSNRLMSCKDNACEGVLSCSESARVRVGGGIQPACELFLSVDRRWFDCRQRADRLRHQVRRSAVPLQWPSKGALSSQDYSYDRESSSQAEPYLRAWATSSCCRCCAT